MRNHCLALAMSASSSTATTPQQQQAFSTGSATNMPTASQMPLYSHHLEGSFSFTQEYKPNIMPLLQGQAPQLLAPPRSLSPASLCTSYTLTRSPSLQSQTSVTLSGLPLSTQLSQQPPIQFSRILGKLPDLRSLSEQLTQRLHSLKLQGLVLSPSLDFLHIGNSGQSGIVQGISMSEVMAVTS